MRTPSDRLRALAVVVAAIAIASAEGCSSCNAPSDHAQLDASSTALSDGGDAGETFDAADSGADDAATPDAASLETTTARCPPDMVRVAHRYCVDRYEAELVDVASGETLSPYYPPSRKIAVSIQKLWETKRLDDGDDAARAMPLPLLPLFERAHEFEPKAVSRKGVVPQGYTSGELAGRACKNAGKRLCTIDEWHTACRGEKEIPFPYGDHYIQGRCNVFREAHPAIVLHGNPSVGHSDPRLNLVTSKGKSLLRRTGETLTCTSAWEDDAIADMVGNVDEWIDDPEGTFVGGFYARSKRDGCDSIVRNHSIDYWDYSTGVRCCRDLDAAAR